MLNTVELVITKSNNLVVGEPCHCYLIVQRSSYWDYTTSVEDPDNPLEFFYDVHVDFDNWLLSGHKKYCFSSKVLSVILLNVLPVTSFAIINPPYTHSLISGW